MPTLLNQSGFRFFFYSPRAMSLLIFISKGDAVGKIWLETTFERACLNGFTKKEEKKLLDIAERSKEEFKRIWHEYFNK